MACERWRELLSAQLDGEDEAGDRARIDEHLAGCVGCRQWLDEAARVNRLIRTGPALPVPDLSGVIMAALDGHSFDGHAGNSGSTSGLSVAPALNAAPGGDVSDLVGRRGEVAASDNAGGAAGGAGRLVAALFAALGGVGAVQLVLGLAQIGGDAAGEHAHIASDLTASPGHLWHESAAWNVAVGAAFLVIALRRSRPTGLVPMLSAFVGMLLLLSVDDLSAGRVEIARLVSHGFVIIGYLIVVALSRVVAGQGRPPAGRQGAGTGWRLRADEAGLTTPVVPALRLVRRGATAHLGPAASLRTAGAASIGTNSTGTDIRRVA